jgi:hypothetical protein
MVVTGGWRTVRAEFVDLGETPAGSDTAHDCTDPVSWPVVAGEWVAAVLFTPIDRRGSPETWALSTRSVIAIVATLNGGDAELGGDHGHQRSGACRPG